MSIIILLNVYDFQCTKSRDELSIDYSYRKASYTPASSSLLSLQNSTKSSSNTRSQKLLVVLIGQLRGGNYAWDSFSRYILDFYHADLALSGPVPKISLPTKFQRAKYVWYENTTDFGGILDIAGNGQSWRNLCISEVQFLGGIENCLNGTGGGSGGILLAYRFLAAQHIEKLNLISKYDWFMFSRSDYLYLCSPAPLNLFPPNAIYVPQGQRWGGYSDRHMLVSSHLALKALNITVDVTQNWIYYFNCVMNNSFKSWTNLETLQRIYYERVGIPVIHEGHTAFIVKRKSDSTRFSPGYKHPKIDKFGLHVKYPAEVDEAAQHCDPFVHNEAWAFKYFTNNS